MPNAIHNSFWTVDQPLCRRFETLAETHETDILVIGAGISGLSIAAELASRGRKVTVCEALVIGAGTTGGSSGHLDAHPEMGPAKLIKSLGETLAREYVMARQKAIDAITRIASNQCDLVSVPAFQYSESDADKHTLEKDFEAAKTLGLNVSWCDSVPIARSKFGYEIQGTARINTLKYLKQLTDVAVSHGVSIFENTLVDGTTEKNIRSLKAGDGEIRFNQVICAVHSNYTAAMHIYAATPAYQSYVVSARILDVLPDALFWDSSDPYYYTRRARSDDSQLILVGGCDHRTGSGDEAEALEKLERWVCDRFQVAEIISRWSAELFEPTDRLPLIGKAFGDNMWVVTGLSGVGLTQGTASGIMIADMIDGIESPFFDAVSPSRFAVGNPIKWLGEQSVAAINLIKQVLPSSSVDTSALKQGEGAIGTVNGSHVAVCRDKRNCLHHLNPKCTHMGGEVRWNEVEQTWDCPVHGGRFKPSGERLYGPPEDPLPEVET